MKGGAWFRGLGLANGCQEITFLVPFFSSFGTRVVFSGPPDLALTRRGPLRDRTELFPSKHVRNLPAAKKAGKK